MKFFALSVLLSVLIAGVLSACHEKKENTNTRIQSEDFAEWNAEEYSLYSRKIREEIHSLRLMPSQMYADSYARRYYADNAPFLWITRSGIDERADTLLAYLRNHPATGLSETAFHISEIQDCLQRIRQLAFDDRNDINTVFGRAEFLLTQTYLRYACGQRFGYIRPSMLFNRLEKSDTTKNAPFVQLYDIETENADEEFVQRALSALQDDRLGDFLLDIQPQSPLYLKMEETYRQANDQTSLRKIAANIERSRWRTPQPEGKHVWVNLAAATLQATDEDGHTALDMRICIGSKQHKTPMLHSRIERADLNPYWNVPYSIIKKEIAPRHAGDVDYFERNHYRIFDKESGEEMPPADVTAAMLASGNYKVRQDNGDHQPRLRASGKAVGTGHLLTTSPRRTNRRKTGNSHRPVPRRPIRAIRRGRRRTAHRVRKAKFRTFRTALHRILYHLSTQDRWMGRIPGPLRIRRTIG